MKVGRGNRFPLFFLVYFAAGSNEQQHENREGNHEPRLDPKAAGSVASNGY